MRAQIIVDKAEPSGSRNTTALAMALVNFSFPVNRGTSAVCISLHTQQQCHSHQAHAPTANDFENIIQDALRG